MIIMKRKNTEDLDKEQRKLSVVRMVTEEIRLPCLIVKDY